MLDLRKSSSALMSVFLFISSSFVVANAVCRSGNCDGPEGPEVSANTTSDSGEAVPCDSSKEDCSSKDSSQYSYNHDSDHDSDQESGSGHGGTNYSQAEEQGKDNSEESKSSDESDSYGA